MISKHQALGIWLAVAVVSLFLVITYPPKTGCENACGEGLIKSASNGCGVYTCYHTLNTGEIDREFRVFCETKYDLIGLLEIGYSVVVIIVGMVVVVSVYSN